MIVLRLPFPPSCNHMYRRNGGGGVRLSKYAVAYRVAVRAILALQRVRPIGGPVCLTVDLHPPSGRARPDADNPLKALLDALQAGGAFADDREVARLVVTVRGAEPGGEVRVRVESYTPE